MITRNVLTAATVIALLATSLIPKAEAAPNIASGKNTSQSSTYTDASAERAVDGNTDGDYSQDSVTHTLKESVPWWQVDLGASCLIESIQLWNRTDCCSDRLDNFYIFVSKTPFTSKSPTTTAGQSGVWSVHMLEAPLPNLAVPVDHVGRYVRIQLAKRSSLSLAEVQVFGLPIIYADQDAPGSNSGTSWENAYHFVQDALTAAYSSQPVAVLVAEGTYTPDSSLARPGGTGDRQATFQMANGITLRGGYAGFGHANPDIRRIGEYETILSGDLDGDDVYVADPDGLLAEPTRAENSYHVVISTETGPSAVLQGFTISGGQANGPTEIDGAGLGGGMFNTESSPTISDCTFTENAAVILGGGMYNESYSMPTITMCTFFKNYSAARGGGIGSYSSAPVLTDCAFIGNRAWGGAGMENDYATGLALTLLTRCTFTNNTADKFGAGMYNGHSSPIVSNCLFAGNCVLNAYGGRGGGVANFNSEAEFYNCTFAENRSQTSGSAVENLKSYPTFLNCIFWDNQVGWDGDEITGGEDVYIGYSNVQGGWSGPENIDADPYFARQGEWDLNGTPKDANDDLWLAGDYHLKSSAGRWDPDSQRWAYDNLISPCIDTGYHEDQVGEELGPNGGIINMGFYGGTHEASMSLCPAGHPADCDGDGIVDTFDLLRLGQQWLAVGDSIPEDINRDGVVNFADFAIMSSHWLQPTNVSCRPVIFTDSFEGEDWDGLWTEDGQDLWYLSDERSAEGAASAAVKGPANNALLTSVSIDVADQDRAYVVIYFDWYVAGFESGDYLEFDVSSDGGSTWRQKATLDGHGGTEGNGQQVYIRIDNTGSVRLRFRANITDSDGQAYLDAVNVATSYH